MSEVDLFESIAVGAGCFSYDVVLNHVGVIRPQCSWRRGDSFSIAHEIDLYLWARSLPLDPVVARIQLRAADLYGIRNRNRVLILIPCESAHRG